MITNNEKEVIAIRMTRDMKLRVTINANTNEVIFFGHLMANELRKQLKMRMGWMKAYWYWAEGWFRFRRALRLKKKLGD